jgi:hypothetical protein
MGIEALRGEVHSGVYPSFELNSSTSRLSETYLSAENRVEEIPWQRQ